MVVISVFIIHCDTVNSRSYNRAENGKRERVVKRRFFGFFQKPDVAGALMGHARAFTRKLWKLTVTICEARLSGRAEPAGRAEGRGWQDFTGDLGWNVGMAIFLRAAIIDFSTYV